MRLIGLAVAAVIGLPGLARADCPGAAGTVDYAGCCAGSTVYWCEADELKSLECSQNPKLTECGYSTSKGVADCVAPGGRSAPACALREDDAAAEEGGTGSGDQGPGSEDGAGSGDGGISLDGIAVPDVNAPEVCAVLAGRYQVESTDCAVFASSFRVKQEGCAVVLAGLVPSLSDHPCGWVSKTGVAFQYTDAGRTKQCVGQLKEDKVEGQCTWDGSACTFVWREQAESEPEPTTGGGSGGCGMGAGNSGGGDSGGRWPLAVVTTLAVAVIAGTRRRDPIQF